MILWQRHHHHTYAFHTNKVTGDTEKSQSASEPLLSSIIYKLIRFLKSDYKGFVIFSTKIKESLNSHGSALSFKILRVAPFD